MNRFTKLVLDIAMGAVVPILILNNLTEPLGAPRAYLLSALVPVGWVFVDLLFITRRFNFITSYIGLSAIMRGLLAFWLVDGVRFALKDTASSIFTVLVFGGSVLIGKPIMRYFMVQSLNPDTPARDLALADLFRISQVHRMLVRGSIILIVANFLTGIVNFWLNLEIVVAPFGTTEFNQQVARVNAITRFALGLPEIVAIGVAFWLIYRALYAQLPAGNDSASPDDFWERLEQPAA
jgi:hypothetical protein